PLAAEQLLERSGDADADVEVPAQKHRFVRLRHSVDENGGPQQLGVGRPLVVMARGVQVPDDERAAAATKANGLADPTLLSPGEARNEAEAEAPGLSAPELTWIEYDVPVLDDAELGADEDRVRLTREGGADQAVV